MTKTTSTKSVGNVTMTLESYNELILRLAKYESSLKVKKGWSDEIEVEMDLAAMADIITEKFEVSGYAETFKMRPSGEWNQSTVRIADLIKSEEQLEAERIAEEERNDRYTRERIEREERKRAEEAAK